MSAWMHDLIDDSLWLLELKKNTVMAMFFTFELVLPKGQHCI